MSTARLVKWVVVTALMVTATSYGSWIETLADGDLDLETWEFLAYPQVAGTFTQPILAGEEGNHYLAFEETTSVGASVPGAAFGAAFGSDESFGDVRVGAVVNVAGDASHSYHGLLARAEYLIDDGSISGAPGVIASCYIMHIDWSNGPANLGIDIEKVVQLQNMMDTDDFEVVASSFANAESFYAELDVVGSGPVYITASLYEYKGGPLVARTPTMVDTAGKDWWEDADVRDEPFLSGPCGIFAQNEDPEPVGFYTSFDDIAALSDGPSAVAMYPADGATEVTVLPTLSWTEASFATGRQFWFGKVGQMEMVDPAPEGSTYAPGMLEYGQTYQWRVDQIGPNGTVAGHTRTFTTDTVLPIEYFETYAGTDDLTAAWLDSIDLEGWDYSFLETETVSQGAKALRFEYSNQFDPFITEVTRTFAEPQDWTVTNATTLSLMFKGEQDNFEQPLYIRIVDGTGNEATVQHPYTYAAQSEPWRSWDIDLAEFEGVDLTAVASLTIGAGDGTQTDQDPGDPPHREPDTDQIIVDRICLRP